MTEDAPQLRGELRKLSPDGTEARAVLATLVGGLLAVGALASIVAGRAMLALLLLCGAATLGLIVFVVGPRVVETDGVWLLVSDWSKTVWIPLRQVHSVNRILHLGTDRVSVKLGCDTPFGREIVFQPRFELDGLVGQHPVVEELRGLVARAKLEARS